VIAPNTNRPLQLVCYIFNLCFFSHPQQAELLLKSIEPFINFYRFRGLLENRRPSILDVLEVTILIWLSTLVGIATTTVLLRHSMHGLIQHLLTLNKCCQEFGRRSRGRRWWWRHLIVARTSIASHLHKAHQVII
jgi:hypothetical protein